MVFDISSLNTLLYKINGTINASNVEANAPERFINNPKYGIEAANIPLVKTITLLRIIFLKYGYFLKGL